MRGLQLTGHRPARRGVGAVVLALLLAGCSVADTAAPVASDPTVGTSAAGAPTDPPEGAPEGSGDAVPVIEPSGPFRVDTVTLRGAGEERQLDVWIADEPALRGRGLMEREELPDGAGMLFSYDGPTTSSFFMRNTLIPLSIAFFDDGGAVIDILDMQPCEADPCPTYGPDRPFRFAIEVPQGWFAAVGVDRAWRLDTSTVPD